MLIAIFAALALLLLGGGGSEGFLPKDFDKQVKKQMTDKVRKAQVLDLHKQMGKTFKGYNKQQKTSSKKVLALTENHEASADEFRAVVDEFFVERRKTQEKLIDARLKMKDLITREEWGAIFSAKE